MEDLRKQEESKIRSLLADYAVSRADLDALSEENHIKDFVMSKTGMLQGFLNSLNEALTMTANDVYGGAISSLVHSISENPDLIPVMKDANARRFDAYVKSSQDAQNRQRRLGNIDGKVKLLDQVLKAQETKLENRKVIQWVDLNRPVNSMDPMNMIMYDMLSGVAASNQAADSLVQDLYLTKTMEQTQTDDWLRAFAEKKTIRDMDHLYTTLSDNMAPGMTPTQVESLINVFQLHKQGLRYTATDHDGE
jgi:hypothetical protein